MYKLREDTIGRIIYDTFTRCTYFSPILIHNFLSRKNKLLPLYKKWHKERQNDGCNSTKMVVFVVTAETTFNIDLSFS